MEHSFRMLKARLNLDALETRMQPGSLFSSGLDVGAAAEVISRPESTREIKKLQDDSQDIQIVGAPADNHVQVTQNVAAPKTGETKETNGLPVTQQNQRPANANPAIRPPVANNGSSNGQVSGVRNVNTADMKVAPVVARETHRQAFNFAGPKATATAIDPSQIKVESCDSGSTNDGRLLDGTISAFSYTDGATGAGPVSTVNGVASGRGAHNNVGYAVGSRGIDAMIQRTPDAGGAGCLSATLAAGAPSQANGVYFQTNAVLVVGTVDNAVDDQGFILALDPGTLALINGYLYGAAGFDLGLNGVSTRLSPQNLNLQEVVTNGFFYDTAGATSYNYYFNFSSVSTGMVEIAQTGWTYFDIDTGTILVDCYGDGIDADRLGNTYQAISCDEADAAGYLTNVFARLNSDDATILYGVTLWDGVAFSSLAPQGNFDARLLGGTIAASGARTVGGFQLTGLNPGYVASLNVKWTDLSNPSGPAFTGGIWYIIGLDLYGNDVAITRDGEEFVASNIDDRVGDAGGYLLEYTDGFAANVAGYGFDVIGTNEYANGVDMQGAPGSDPYLGGDTSTDLGAGINCDLDFNGAAVDGWMARFGNI